MFINNGGVAMHCKQSSWLQIAGQLSSDTSIRPSLVFEAIMPQINYKKTIELISPGSYICIDYCNKNIRFQL